MILGMEATTKLLEEVEEEEGGQMDMKREEGIMTVEDMKAGTRKEEATTVTKGTMEVTTLTKVGIKLREGEEEGTLTEEAMGVTLREEANQDMDLTELDIKATIRMNGEDTKEAIPIEDIKVDMVRERRECWIEIVIRA
eukprot:TRINITY_DN722_c0_g1_i1.p2 TRINITY_DN722_c0_g1~~TRINITY_DN722_c0_g1_i1.p2  ORF type:complete len:139 (-),score=34.02 TRINITY_DN722_c0_g1_i1:803-1219(-)